MAEIAKLKERIFDAIDEVYAQAKAASENKDYPSALRLCDEAWAKIPEPKLGWDFSYIFVYWRVQFLRPSGAGLDGLIDLVEKYAASGYCKPHDFGVPFMLGTLHFERQEFDKAFEFFKKAQELSGGHCFSEQDPKYRAFFKERRAAAKRR